MKEVSRSHNMSTQTLLKAGILIVSDTAYRDPTTDKASDVLQNVFVESGNGQWNVAKTHIIPDDSDQIQDTLREWCSLSEDQTINLIVTTGGTGFAIKDVTPEAVEPLLTKNAPGLV